MYKNGIKISFSLFCFTILITSVKSQIRDFQDEKNTLGSLYELITQSIFKRYSPGIYEDSMRQHISIDWKEMEILYRRTNYEKEEDNKTADQISWLVQFHIPLLAIDTIMGDYKNQTITYKVKGDSAFINGEILIPGNKYAPASKDKSLTIYSGQIMKIRNLVERIQDKIKEFQVYYKKKQQLVNTLNNYLKKELDLQQKYPDQYPAHRKFSLIQPFQLDDYNRLSIVINRDSIIEKQSVYLEDVTEIAKDINIIFLTKGKHVETIQTFANGTSATTKGNLFFLQLCYEKQDIATGNKIAELFSSIGSKASRTDWYD